MKMEGVVVSRCFRIGAAADLSRRKRVLQEAKMLKDIGFIVFKRCSYFERESRVGCDLGTENGPKRRSKIHEKVAWKGSRWKLKVDVF